MPYEYIKQKVDVRVTRSTIEIFFDGNRICSHRRLYGRAINTTPYGMKMSYTGDAKIITRVSDLMDQIIEDETKNIPALLDLLQNK